MSDPALDSPAFRERYEIREAIGTGGFGRVYRARQRTTDQDVAVKVLSIGDGDADELDLARFRQELAMCASLHHPNIVRLVDSGGTEGDGRARSIFAVFELIPGSTLADLIGAEGALDPAEAIHLASQVLDALACAHDAGVVHRDLKPANVMVTPTGARRNAMVLDFGLGTFYERALTDESRLTQGRDFLGTPAYAAPEQLWGEGAGPASDLYAWGLVLIECLVGHPLFEGPVAHVIHRQLSPQPVPIPEVLADHPLGRLLAAVTEKDRTRRPAAAADVLAELGRAAAAGLPERGAFGGSEVGEDAGAGSPVSGRLRGHWLVPLHRNPNFIGRVELLSRVARALRGTGHPVVALRGLGGVGKSQIALEYAYRHGHEYEVVAWLRAEEPETLADDFAGLAQSLGLREAESPDQRTRVEAATRWLERHDDWLLVFDNAPNPDGIRRFLPRNSGGHVLVTSRHPSWRALATSIEIDELTLEESASFLMRRTGERSRETAEALAESLGRLPLALEEAAAYIESTGRSLASYAGLLGEQQQVLQGGVSLPGLARSLRGTWELSFGQVEEELPAAADLLRLFAFLAPDDISFPMLAGSAEVLPPALAEAVADPIKLDACVAALRRYSLIKVEDDAASLHRMVQLATRSRFDAAEHDAWSARALRLVTARFPDGLAGDFFQPEARRLLPHAMAVLDHAGDLRGEWLALGRLRRRAGNYLSALGLHAEAAEHLERALRHLESGDETAGREVAGTLADLGLIYYALGEFERSTARGERALEIHEQAPKKRGLRVAVDHMNLAWVLRSRGHFEAVREHCLAAIAIIESAVGPTHALTAMPRGPLSRALWGLGDFEGARREASLALEVLEQAEVHHPLLCACWYSVGQVLYDFGETEAAGRCATAGIEIGEQAYGRDHPQVAVTRVVLGMVRLRGGDLEGAAEAFERAIEAGERSSPRQHEDMAIARCLLARVRRHLGDPGAAAAALEEARATLPRVAGERTRTAAQIELECGWAALDGGDFAAARRFGEAADAALTGYPAEHPYRIPAWALVATARLELGDVEAARAGARRALEVGEAAFDRKHPDLEPCLRILEDV